MTTLIIKDLPNAEELKHKEMVAVRGGSIYVDGQYWGEGKISLYPSPSGVPVWDVWPDGTRTPH